jgi:hypothetical protein
MSPEKDSCTILENIHNSERLCNVFYSKDFTVFPIKEYSNEKSKKAFIGIVPLSNNDLIREEVLKILEFLDIEHSVVKYFNDKNPVILSKNGHEKPVTTQFYPSPDVADFYISEGISFCFQNQLRYFFPKKKEHLKNGMIIEFLNNDIWKSKEVLDLDEEYSKMYSLLIKYNKLRIPIN